jgi:hypothetical protein
VGFGVGGEALRDSCNADDESQKRKRAGNLPVAAQSRCIAAD